MTPTTTPTHQAVTRHIVVAIALLAVAVVVYTIADALVIGFGGIVLATVLLSLARPLAQKTKLSARWSLMVVIAVLLSLSILFFWLFGNEVANEFTELQQRLPGALSQFQVWLKGLPAGDLILDSIKTAGLNEAAFTRLSSFAGTLLGATGNLLLILFLAIYFASDPLLYRDGALRLIPLTSRSRVRRSLDHAGVSLRKWVVAQAIAMLAVGVLTGVSLAIIGVPLALSLGVVAALFEFIPVIGPLLAAIPGVLLAFSVGPQQALYATLVYIAVQQVESNIITPLVQRWAVKLPQVVGLIAIVICGLLFGVVGVIFAMPIAVVAMVLIKELYVEDTLEAGQTAAERKQLARETARSA